MRRLPLQLGDHEKPGPPTAGTRIRLRIPIMVKSLGVVLSCALIPLVLSWVLTVPRGMRALEDTTKQNLQVVARVTATQLDQLFVDTSRLQGCLATEATLVRFCTADASLRVATMAQVQRRLGEVLAANPDLALLYLADSDGICRASTKGDMVGIDYRTTRLYMREALAGNQHISDLAVGITTNEPGVFMAGPVRDADKRIVGALVMKIKGQVIDATCDGVTKRVAGGFAAVVDSRHVFISHPDPQVLYHSVGDSPDGTIAGINPKLQYGVESVKSLGMNALANKLRNSQGQGCVSWIDAHDNSQVAGFAAMTTRPWKVIVAQPRAMFDQPMIQLRRGQVAVLIGAVIGSVLLAFVFIRQLVRPIKSLSSAANRLAQGDWMARASLETNDELGDLARTFNDMVPKLQEQTKMQDALHLAMEIQRNLLPHKAPAVVGADVAGVNIPADQTGGDYYDFLDLSAWERDTLAVAVGDVTGHGISAALLMTTARALLRSRATPPGAIAQLIADVNTRLSDDAPDGRFMTLLYMIIDCRGRNVRLVSAGHDPVLCYDPDKDQFSELGGTNLPLAVDKDESFVEVEYRNMPAGTILLIGTDGIWETSNHAQEMYGKDRLRSLMRLHKNRSSQCIVNEIVADLARFRGDPAQQDDITAVVIKLHGEDSVSPC